MVRIKTSASGQRFVEVEYVRPDEFVANRRHGTNDEASLVLDFSQRHPAIPEWRPYPEALVKDARLEGMAKDRSLLRLTDDAFWRLELAEARTRGTKALIERHERQDAATAEDHTEATLAAVARGRAHFFQEVHRIMVARDQGHVKARRLQQALFAFLRAHTLKRSLHEMRDTHRLIKEGFARHAGFLAWRLDNLYTMTSSHSFGRQKHNGFTLEHVIGNLLWDLRRVVTGRHHEWRHDTLYQTHANGSISHVHHAPGQPLEHVIAAVEWPKTHERSARFDHWRRSITVVETPNHALVHLLGQGSMPEAAWAKLAAPLTDKRARQALDWHLTHLLETLPNGGFTPSPVHSHGHTPEKVTADVAWRDKHVETRRHRDFRLGNQMIETPNGGFAHTKQHFGQAPERVPADVAWPKKAHVTHSFGEWHAAHLYGETPNHGYAPLKAHGRPLEAIGAEAGDRPKHVAKAATELWHATHRFRETPNHAYGPVKTDGGSLESVAAAATDRPRHAAKTGTDLWHATHRFHETPNHAYAPLKTLGGSLEHVSAAFTSRIKDEVTRRLLEHRLTELYTPTANGTWRRLGRDGKALEHVTAQVTEPDEGQAAQGPLPAAGGHVLQAAEVRLEGREHLKRSVKEFQRNLAAHERTVSQLQAHVIAPPTPTPAAASAPPAAGPASKVRKVG